MLSLLTFAFLLYTDNTGAFRDFAQFLSQPTGHSCCIWNVLAVLLDIKMPRQMPPNTQPLKISRPRNGFSHLDKNGRKCISGQHHRAHYHSRMRTTSSWLRYRPSSRISAQIQIEHLRTNKNTPQFLSQ
jgi:hypothetical protein